MLKNPKKADLDKDGELSSYEKKRGMAIERNMKAKTGKMMKAKSGKMTGQPGGIFAQIKSLSPSMLDKVNQMKSAGKAGLKKKSLGGDIKKIKAKKMMKAMTGMEVKGYGQARSKGMGLQDESVPMKDNSYIKDLI